MKIDTIDPNAAAGVVAEVQRSQQPALKTSLNRPTEKNTSTEIQSSDKVSIQLEVPRKTVETLQQFGQMGDFLNTLATNLRKTQETLKDSSDLINKMKGKLDTIVKNYPPYGIENKERIELLMSYSGLQKEIKSLMIPPPPPPVYEKVEHMWQNLFAGQDGTIPAPQVPVDAPDSHVKLAAKQLDSISDQVGLVREALSNSIKAL